MTTYEHCRALEKRVAELQTQLKKRPMTRTESAELAPIDAHGLLRQAIESGTDPDRLQQLLDFAERADAISSKKRFGEALANFQSDCPPIPRTHEVRVGSQVRSRYSPLETIVSHIAPHMRANGFSYRFATEHQTGGNPRVECILTHVAGHSERSSFTAPPDNSGGKAAIQANASTVAYARRYALCDVLGLTFTDEDTDGDSGLAEIIAQLEENLEAVDADDTEFSQRLLILLLERSPDYWKRLPKSILAYAATVEGFEKIFPQKK